MSPSAVLSILKTTLSTARNSVDPCFDASQASLSFRPSSQAWTSAEILEHIVLTSKFLLILIEKGAKKALKNTQERDLEKEWASYELTHERLEAIGQHKAFAWMRPEHMEPTGTVDLAEVRAVFHAQLDRCEALLDELSEGQGVLYKTTMSVNEIGKLDVYQYIYFLAKHALRHVQQIEKNAAAFAENSY